MNYYDMMIQQLLASGSPEYSGLGGERSARADASQLESNMLNYQMGSKRKRTKNDRLPEGSYAQAMYPGLEYDVWAAKRGLAPRGAGAGAAIIPGSEEDDFLNKLRRSWGINQGAMIPRGNFVSRMGGR